MVASRWSRAWQIVDIAGGAIDDADELENPHLVRLAVRSAFRLGVVDRGHRNTSAATVIDLYSRWAIGWSVADHMRTELVSDAL